MRLPTAFCSKHNKTLFFLSNDGLAYSLGGLEKKDCSKLSTELWERAFCFHFRPASFLVVLILLKLLDIFFLWSHHFGFQSAIFKKCFFFFEVLQLSSICAKCWRRAERGTDERSLTLTDNAFSYCTHCVDHLTVESSADVTSLPQSLPSCLLY